MKNRIKVLIMSFVAITICLTMVTLGTFALFSDTAIVNHHLQAGNLDVLLERTNLKSKVLGVDGYLELKENNNLVDFTSNSTKNIFDLESSLMVPGTYYEATLKLTNNGSVALGYYIAVDIKEQLPSNLASQIKVYVTTYNENESEVIHSAYLKDGLLIGSNVDLLGKLASNESSLFKVKVVFEDLDNNNDAMNCEVNFDLTVYAIQVLEK